MNKNSRKAAETQRARKEHAKKLMNDFCFNSLEGKIIKMKIQTSTV